MHTDEILTYTLLVMIFITILLGLYLAWLLHLASQLIKDTKRRFSPSAISRDCNGRPIRERK